MKYSIRGRLRASDEAAAIEIINQYKIWKLQPDPPHEDFYIFEVWVKTEEEKDSLYNDLQDLVDVNNPDERLDWHICTHDEDKHEPCIILGKFPDDTPEG